jgi:hypothetical protein
MVWLLVLRWCWMQKKEKFRILSTTLELFRVILFCGQLLLNQDWGKIVTSRNEMTI